MISIGKVLREIHSEPGPVGTLSWGRVACSISLLSTIAWITHILWHTHGLPSLTEPSMFALAPYGVNKSLTTIQNVFSKQ